jgi:hypothetical protein
MAPVLHRIDFIKVKFMIQNDIIQFLKKVPPFQFLDEPVLMTVAKNISMEFYPKGRSSSSRYQTERYTQDHQEGRVRAVKSKTARTYH